ncbi:hypothetical protein [Photobacterium ganghwense]|uniref:hypothetical protein n=1 Tax=Photobacterium ganghwense TaxID=320778 RepID=UPI001A8F82CE|nr:hypothetical protein [Photobacterium ganghwense]QSV17607.1 hypothetical protein FH974_25285 [Photobacterium ganghwense]
MEHLAKATPLILGQRQAGEQASDFHLGLLKLKCGKELWYKNDFGAFAAGAHNVYWLHRKLLFRKFNIVVISRIRT